ncbi:MarR family winged helix-turn-helix transcriptional regulator [Streptomyces sp. NPDC087300]|uniref:MarR family winged helix-turn-helix transcriptional regulator n=1 Tax=Streptomyces sp. NPDC087300 TaxID=3365780 RepID=UPI00382E0751
MGPRSAGSEPAAAATELADDVRDLVRLVTRFTRRVRDPGEAAPAALRALLGDAGLANRHMEPLISLAMDGPASVGELAERLALGPTTTSQLVNELHRGGLVARTEDDADRRRTIVSVLEPHRSLIEQCARLRLAPLHDALARLSPAARKDFIRTWQLVVAACER